MNSKYIDRVIVSTNGEKVAKIDKKYSSDISFLRPDYLIIDTVNTIDYVMHYIEELQSLKYKYDYVVLL